MTETTTEAALVAIDATALRDMLVEDTLMGFHVMTGFAGLIGSRLRGIRGSWMEGEAAQGTLANNHISAKNTTRKYLLRSVIVCGSCGRRYVGSAWPGNHRMVPLQRPPDTPYTRRYRLRQPWDKKHFGRVPNLGRHLAVSP